MVKTVLSLVFLTTASSCTFFHHPKSQKKVVVIGAGVAGLAAAYRLNQAGILASIFEASTRTGGRMWSSTLAGLDHVSEMGASFINSDQQSVLRLVDELKLELVSLAKRPDWTNELVYGQGKKWTKPGFFKAADSALQKIMDHQASAVELERATHMSMDVYLASIDAPKVMRDVIRSQYHNECGLDLSNINARFLLEQTTLDLAEKGVNFISALGDEAFTIKGGVSKITEGLTAALLPNIHFGKRLAQVSQNPDGTYVLQFEQGNKFFTEVADYVIITTPLPILQKEIRFNVDGLSPIVREKLSREILGQNDKVFFFYQQPFWHRSGIKNARIIVDEYELHDSIYGQEGISSLTLIRGGSDAQTPVDNSLSERMVKGLESLFPGSKQHFIRSAVGLNWPTWDSSKGSYVCDFGPDYWYKSQTMQAQPTSGRLFFAGEAWGLTSQGYMDSAVESAEFAARAIINQI